MTPPSGSRNIRIPAQAGDANSASASWYSGLSGGLRSRSLPCGRNKGRARRIRWAMEPTPRAWMVRVGVSIVVVSCSF